MHDSMEQQISLVESVDLFKGIPGLDEERISGHCRWQRYPKKGQILSSDDVNTDVFFVVRGTVMARSYSKEGKEVTYNTIGQGEIFGEFSAIDGKSRSASIDAIEDCLIARMTSGDFRALMVENSLLGLRLSEILVAKTRALTERIFEYGTLPVRERVQRELLRLCANAKHSEKQIIIDPAPTHYEIATRIATHREAVSRELNQLALGKIIEIDRRRIKVLDLERLREFHNTGSP